jgi:hypothetical protein
MITLTQSYSTNPQKDWIEPQDDGWGQGEDEHYNQEEDPVEFFMNKEITPF